MMSPAERQQFDQLVRKVDELLSTRLEDRKIYQQDIANKEVKQRHIDGMIIFKGVAADRPTNGSTEIQAWWATDTGVLSIWSGSAWLSETLT